MEEVMPEGPEHMTGGWGSTLTGFPQCGVVSPFSGSSCLWMFDKMEVRPPNLVSFVGITHFAKLSTHFLSQVLQSQKQHIEIKWVSFTWLQLLAFLPLQGINQQQVSKQWHRHLISFLLLESCPHLFFFSISLYFQVENIKQ